MIFVHFLFLKEFNKIFYHTDNQSIKLFSCENILVIIFHSLLNK